MFHAPYEVMYATWIIFSSRAISEVILSERESESDINLLIAVLQIRCTNLQKKSVKNQLHRRHLKVDLAPSILSNHCIAKCKLNGLEMGVLYTPISWRGMYKYTN